MVRELLAGPRRFKDLTDGLPGISTNLLAERLRSLERQGLLRRRILPPPAGSAVYELTSWGQALEPVVLELGKWGGRLLPASVKGDAWPSVGSCALGIIAFFRPEQAQGINETYELHLGNEVLQVRIRDGELQVEQGGARKADAVFHTDMPSYLGIFSGQITPEQAVSTARVRVEGDPGALRRFLNLFGLPSSP
ncbi:MAG: winged helix-turn-helix transcriptional regulator [Ardenticatenaceae bacterium]|nr:winged helix-turn-helix transcriptional regulator [Ardenticatenaceae bacterium]